MQTWGLSMERKFGLPCGNIGTLMLNASPRRCVLCQKLYFSSIKCVPQVKPKLTQVRDISKKINKDTGDDAGIFMGDCKYFTLKYQTSFLIFFNTHNTLWRSLNYNESSLMITSVIESFQEKEFNDMTHRCKTADMNLQLKTNRFYTQNNFWMYWVFSWLRPPITKQGQAKICPKN